MNCHLPTIKKLLKYKDDKIEEQRVVINLLVNAIQAVQEKNSNLNLQLKKMQCRDDREG
jgi:C4-dicarboxylate-specific signal transduction histidine kinase